MTLEGSQMSAVQRQGRHGCFASCAGPERASFRTEMRAGLDCPSPGCVATSLADEGDTGAWRSSKGLRWQSSSQTLMSLPAAPCCMFKFEARSYWERQGQDILLTELALQLPRVSAWYEELAYLLTLTVGTLGRRLVRAPRKLRSLLGAAIDPPVAVVGACESGL
jgi:hypothetical protein